MNQEKRAFKGRQLLPLGAVCAVLGVILSSTLIFLPLGLPLGIAGLLMMGIGLASRFYGS